ncbi:DNA primase, partial [Mycolicibacterium sphagni]|uniref:DNA primase n=1 Tax=Mycolicibacterium sphagni TaxID=1786 RepID=UPI0021F36BE7
APPTPDTHNLDTQTPAATPIAVSTDIADIEYGFWESRANLRYIYEVSLARMVSPWAVLALCAARTLCLVPPRVMLPAVIGAGGGSLNSYFALVAKSSGGKGAATQVAGELVPAFIHEIPAGTGEGVLAVLDGGKDDDHQIESVLFDIPETDQLKAMTDRTGSSLMSVLRSGWSGENLGFSYADKTKRRFRAKHTYRMCLVMGVQPEKAGWIIGDAAGGTPQRFLWFPAIDKRCKARLADPSIWIAPLQLPSALELQYPRVLRVPDETVELILATREANHQGDVGALDGHGLFAREKFAYALTLLDGRVEMNLEDWELSGVAANVSQWTREEIVDTLKAADHRAAEVRGALRGVEMYAADAEKDEQYTKQAQRVMRWLLRKLDEVGDDGITQKELVERVAGRDRKMLNSYVLTKATEEGLVRTELVEGVTRWWRRR